MFDRLFRIVIATCLAGAVSLADAAPAAAQGRRGPPPVAPGQSKKPVTTTTTPGATRGRQQTFGSWLDNAEVNAPGEAWMSLSTTYWRSSFLREIDAPAIGIAVGVAPRMHIGVSLPYYHVTDQTGSTFHGVGATYITGKVALTEGARVGVAVSPTVEVLSWSPAETGASRVNWLLPLSVQTDIGSVRVYGTTGYVSRGSVFGSGAAEWSAGSHTTLAVTFSHTYSTASDPVSDALGVTRHRTDAGGGIYVSATPAVVIFANVGRTFAPVDDTSSRIALYTGIAINVAGPATRAPRVP